MSIASIAVEKKAVTYFATFLLTVGGIGAFFGLGQLEDPAYTVKTAQIFTEYPGASPEEVELEVSDRIETAIQELKELKWVESTSRAGLSTVKVEILPYFWGEDLYQVWDHLRKKLREVENKLPPGAKRPTINDDFGDVFGFQLALIGEGYDARELEKFAKELRKELVTVAGVARVDLWGVQEKVIYLDVRETQLAQLGLSDDSIVETLKQQNLVVDGGSLDLGTKRYRIAPTGEFRSPQDIADVVVRPSAIDAAQAEQGPASRLSGSEIIRISDIGTVRRGYRDPPENIMIHNGRPAIGLSITNRPGVNIVEVGRAIDQRLAEIKPLFPIGIEWEEVHWQSDIVDESVTNFLINFAEAVAIVLVVLTLAMGWRMGVIIGSALIVTVLGTFLIMSIFDIDLHRISLGALVIALGMMVDNSIVVAEGMLVRLQGGMNRVKAAIESASQPATPLLGATIIAVMAFYPISGSPESTGEYCKALFQVVGISLILSWLVSITFTPVQCMDMLPAPKPGDAVEDPYGSGFYKHFRGFLESAIRFRIFTLAGMVGLLVISVLGFGQVREMYFPAASMTKFMVDYYGVDGTRIQDVADQLEALQDKLMQDERVETVTAYIGSGPPRFYLPVEPEEPNRAYGQLIINVANFEQIPEMIEELGPWVTENYPDARVPRRQFIVGVGKTWGFEIRLSGPASSDPQELRTQAQKFVDVIEASPYAGVVRNDWVERVERVVPEYNQERARWAGVTRDDVASATKRAYDGREIGLYREGDDLIPILMRHEGEERQRIEGLPSLQLRPALSTEPLPLAQVVDDVATVWEDPVIRRRDRKRTIKIQALAQFGETVQTLADDVTEELQTIELPPGYRWEWGGDIEDQIDGNEALIPGLLPAFGIIVFILVAQFNALRPAVVMLLTTPFAIIGITWSMLALDIPFGFMSLLGGMSLVGMMIKNAIVLLDQVEIELRAGKSRYDAIVDSAVMRLRPVGLAAATTVLGVVPLLQDVFWVSMAVTIMGGLAVGTVLTMVLLPVLYVTFYGLRSPELGAQPAAA